MRWRSAPPSESAIDITLASMSGPIGIAPQAHIFFDSHVDWVSVVDELPKK